MVLKSPKLFAAESYRRGFAATSALTLLTQVAGLAVIGMVAHFFGTTVETDIYLYACTLSTTLALYLAGIVQAVLVPEAMHRDAAQGRVSCMTCLNSGIALLAGIAALPALGLVFFPAECFGVVSRFSPDDLSGNCWLLRAMAPVFLLETVSMCLSLVCSAFHFFSISSLATFGQRLLQAILLAVGWRDHGIAVLVAATVAGLVLSVGLLVWVLRARLEWRTVFSWASLRGTWARDAVVTLGVNLTTSAVFQIPLFLLSGIGPGVVTMFNYAARIQGVVQSLLLTPYASTVSTRLFRAESGEGTGGSERVFRSSFVTMLLLLVPASLLMALEAPRVVRFLLMHGGALDALETEQIAVLLRAMLVALPFWGINTVVWRLVMARRQMLRGSVFQLVQNIVLAVVLVIASLGGDATWIVLATSLFMVWNAFTLGFLLARVSPGLGYWRAWAVLPRIVLLSCIAAALVVVTGRLLSGFSDLLVLVCGGLVFVTTIALLLPLMRFDPEVDSHIRQFFSRIRLAGRPAVSGMDSRPDDT